MRENIGKLFVLLSIFVLCGSFVVYGVFATPNGATTVSQLSSSSASSGAAGNNSAMAGNVTELSVYGISNTQSWQAYFGNVSGAIRLSDGTGATLYNWTLASPQGEIYASTNGTIQWQYVQCLNYTALGNYTSDIGQAGNTSLYGTNLTQLESMFGINEADADGVNETFNLIGATTHDAFFVGSAQFDEGECRNTRVFDSTGQGVSNNFEEVLLYEPQTTSVIFASILENNLAAYNNRSSDFEMLVLENGHSGDTATTPYYFFVELQ